MSARWSQLSHYRIRDVTQPRYSLVDVFNLKCTKYVKEKKAGEGMRGSFGEEKKGHK